MKRRGCQAEIQKAELNLSYQLDLSLNEREGRRQNHFLIPTLSDQIDDSPITQDKDKQTRNKGRSTCGKRGAIGASDREVVSLIVVQSLGKRFNLETQMVVNSVSQIMNITLFRESLELGEHWGKLCLGARRPK